MLAMSPLFARFSAVVVAGLLLTGCSGAPAENRDDVASLATGAASGPSASASSAPERPLIRSDTSDAELQRMQEAWQDCLAKNGGSSKEDYAEKKTEDVPQSVIEADKKAAEACADMQPEEVWERAKRTDPLYADKLRDWITCVRAEGINAWESEGFITYESLPPPKQMKKVHACEEKVFGRG
jgi:hypothetical protein